MQELLLVPPHFNFPGFEKAKQAFDGGVNLRGEAKQVSVASESLLIELKRILGKLSLEPFAPRVAKMPHR
ncbi:MAG TPA: hypothetical protein VHL58_06470, partial [Thermoanaerobaculia bacterium]|nr:hypothetical protein [Thermoanaerobaculia bacterium]